MTWDDVTPEPPEQRDPESLDAILRDAVWPDTDPVRVDRLQRDWATINRRRVRVHRTWWLSTAALVGFVVASVALHRVAVDVADRPSAAPDSESSSELVSNEAEPEKRRRSFPDNLNDAMVADDDSRDAVKRRDESSGDPTALQQLLITAVERRARRPQAEPSKAPLDPLRAAIDQVMEQPDVDMAEVCKPWLAQRDEMEQRLARFIGHSQGARQLAAVRLLGHVATHRSLPLLLQLRAWTPTRRDATVAVARLSSPLALAQLAKSEPSPELQQQLLSALLDRGSERAVQLFLRFVNHPATREVALLAAADVAQPPLERLFAYLQGPQVKMRVSAARVLGQVNDPRVSRRLIHLVFHSQAGREALVALSTSREASATEFVARAQLDLSLAASVRAARHRAASLPN